jgi:hypothetical protein
MARSRTIPRMLPAAALLLWVALGLGCGGSRQVPVVLRFDNVRVFVDEQGQERGSEWEAVGPVIRQHHVDDNIYGVDFQVTREARPGDLPEMRLYEYTVQMVLGDLGRLRHLDRDIRQAARTPLRLRGAPDRYRGERAQFSLDVTQLNFRGRYVHAFIDITIFGRTDPGSRVWVYDHASTDPREAEVGQDGMWRMRVSVGERRRYIYGYATDARAPAIRKCFRVDIYTRRQEAVPAESFDRLRRVEP